MAAGSEIPYSAYQSVVEAYLNGVRADEETRKTIIGVIGLASSLASIASGVGSIVGLYGAGMSLFSLLDSSGLGKPDRFLVMVELLEKIDQKLTAFIIRSVAADWQSQRNDIKKAAQQIQDYVSGTATPGEPPGTLKSDDSRKRFYDQVITPIRDLRQRLLPDNGLASVYQESQSWSEYGLTPTSVEFFERVNLRDVNLTGLPAGQEQVFLTGPSNLMWDYRSAVIYVMPALAQLVAAYRYFDPAFRTTGRFKEELQTIIAALEILAARWASLIVWSKRSIDDGGGTYTGLNFPAAYDIRSWIFCSLYTSNPNVAFAPPIPGEPQYSDKRREYANTVVTVTGLRDFYDSIAKMRTLIALPAESESVECNTRINGWRRFVRKQQIKHGNITRYVKVYHVDWQIKCSVRVQPQLAPYDYAAGYPIKYKFFLESHHDTLSGWDDQPIQQVELKPKSGAQQIVIKVNSPEVYVVVEDDGTFGPTSRGGVVRGANPPPPKPRDVKAAISPQQAFSAREIGVVYSGKAASNDSIKTYVKVANALAGLETVGGPPARAHYQYPSLRPATIGVAFNHGPSNDIRAGQVNLEAWNLDGHEENVGALFFVIEEYPPAEPGAVIRTIVHLPINPTEYWYPGLSRAAPSFIPVSP